MIPGEHTVYICSTTSVNELCKEWNVDNVRRNGTTTTSRLKQCRKKREEGKTNETFVLKIKRNIILSFYFRNFFVRVFIIEILTRTLIPVTCNYAL